MKFKTTSLWARFDPITGELLTIHRTRRLARRSMTPGVIRRVTVKPL